MTQVTHEEAHKLIQLRADQELGLSSKESLQNHLDWCTDCQAYASDLLEIERLLQRVTHRQWDKRPAPLEIEVLLAQAQGNRFRLPGNTVTTRSAIVVVAVLALLISTWQFSRTAVSATPGALTLALPIPTPSTVLTSTSLSSQGCEYIVYKVGENDSLESISRRFAVAKSDIMAFNQMTSEIIFIDQAMKIPLCKSTPTGTIGAPTTTITITPQFSPLTTTPG